MYNPRCSDGLSEYNMSYSIVMAACNAAKFLLEEEVFRDRNKPQKTRKTFANFLAIITIALNRKVLIFIFNLAH